MDGIAVDSKFKSTNASDQKTLENYDVYIIPYMFQGMHKIKVTSAMMEDYEEDISVYDEKNITYKSTKVKAETLSQADTVAQDVYKKVIASAVAKDDFSKVKDSFVNDSNFTSSIQSNYEKVRGNLTNSDGYGYKTLSLTSLKGKTDDYYTKIDANGVLTTKVELSVAYSGEYTSRTYSSSLRDYETTSKTKTGTTSATMYLRYENNAWKVYDVYFYSIY